MDLDLPKIDQFWEDQLANSHSHSHSGNSGHLQYERNLNFATVALEDSEYGYPKKKTVRDPLSHRIIEKRRRDRMNNCLADLARLLPAASLRKGRGRIEKTEIVELAIKHLKHLQMHPCPQSDTCEFNQMARNQKSQSKTSSSASVSSGSCQSNSEDNFRLGYQECLSETMHFLVETEGMYAGDTICVRLVKHLNNHCEDLMRDHVGNNSKLALGFPLNSRKMMDSADNFQKSGSPSSGSGYQANGSSSGSDANGGNDGEGSLGNEPFPLPLANLNQHCTGPERNAPNFDYEGDNNSCSSNPLSVEISETLSSDGKNASRSSTKPPIPTIIYSGTSSNNSLSPAVLSSSNGRSSDEGGSSTNSLHRYKFKNNINKRFNADLQIKQEDNISNAENDVYVEENEQNIEERNKLEVDNGTMTSNSSNVDSEPHNSNDIIANVATTTTETGDMTAALASDKVTPSLVIPLISSQVEKPPQIGDDYEKKLGSEELVVPTPPNGIVLKKTCSLPLINATALVSGEESSPLSLASAPACGSTGVGVAAFALHDTGLYYIPLTIDKSIVSPFITAMEPNTQPPLHPVTISVCFLLSGSETEKKIKEAPSLELEKITLPIPVSMPMSLPIPISLPVTVANITPIIPLKPRGLPRDQAFIMNRFTQSQPVTPKVYSGGAGNGYRYPIGMNGSGGSISSGSYSPTNSLITYPVLYGNSPPGSSINFGSHNSHGSLSSYQTSHHSYYNNTSSSSGSNCSGSNNSDSSAKALRSNINTGTDHDGNKPGTNINESSSSGNGSSNNSSGSSVHGHTGIRTNRNSGNTSGSRSQNRKRCISTSPSVCGSNLSSSTGYQSWYEKAPSVSSAESIYSLGISKSPNNTSEQQQNSSYNDSLSHHYGHHGASHLHPHSHGHSHSHSHGHSHIHPQYSHGHSHSHGHPLTHHATHYDENKLEQTDRTKGRSSPNKRSKKSRMSLEQEMQHKHNLTAPSGSIHR